MARRTIMAIYILATWMACFITVVEGDKALPAPLAAVAHGLRKPVRFLNFWRQAVHIYSSYKVTQMHAAVTGLLHPTLGHSGDTSGNDVWDKTHERNSQRMMKLCLGMRGFYLKTGQFLGTRHDFMPPNYTSKVCALARLYSSFSCGIQAMPIPPSSVALLVLFNYTAPHITTLDLLLPLPLPLPHSCHIHLQSAVDA